jgi:hypothetical protein
VFLEVGEHHLVGASEEPFHGVDPFREELPFVEVARAEPQARARPHLATAFALPIAAVLADLLVDEDRVVEPGEHLRVETLRVVALVEGVDRDFPVAVEEDRPVRAKPHLIEVILRIPMRDVTEERLERLAVGVHVHEHEPAPPTDLHVAEVHVVVGHGVGVLVTVDDLDDLTVEVPTPGVVAATDLGGGEVADATCQPGAAVRARVEESTDVVAIAADDEDRLVADRVLDEVAPVRDLFLAARDLPDARPEPFHLEVVELARHVARPGHGDHAVRFRQRERRIECVHGTSMRSGCVRHVGAVSFDHRTTPAARSRARSP